MFFLAGAASSVLNILGSLQGGSGAQQNSAASATTPSQSPFSIPASPADSGNAGSTAATSPNATGNCWSCSETMSFLLSTQSQTTTGAANDPASAGTAAGDVRSAIEQFLATLENQVVAGQSTAGSDGSSDATQGANGSHHRHASGIELLLQAFDSQSGADQGATKANGSTASPDAVGSIMPPGIGLPSSLPFSTPSDSSAPSTGSAPAGSGILPVNPLGRLINLQAQLFAAATAGKNLSTMA